MLAKCPPCATQNASASVKFRRGLPRYEYSWLPYIFQFVQLNPHPPTQLPDAEQVNILLPVIVKPLRHDSVHSSPKPKPVQVAFALLKKTLDVLCFGQNTVVVVVVVLKVVVVVVVIFVSVVVVVWVD